jgi:chromosome segregation ATPase
VTYEKIECFGGYSALITLEDVSSIGPVVLEGYELTRRRKVAMRSGVVYDVKPDEGDRLEARLTVGTLSEKAESQETRPDDRSQAAFNVIIKERDNNQFRLIEEREGLRVRVKLLEAELDTWRTETGWSKGMERSLAAELSQARKDLSDAKLDFENSQKELAAARAEIERLQVRLDAF